MTIEFEVTMHNTKFQVTADISVDPYSGSIDEIVLADIRSDDDITDFLESKTRESIAEQAIKHIPDGPEYEPEDE